MEIKIVSTKFPNWQALTVFISMHMQILNLSSPILCLHKFLVGIFKSLHLFCKQQQSSKPTTSHAVAKNIRQMTCKYLIYWQEFSQLTAPQSYAINTTTATTTELIREQNLLF